jgi:thiol:disulfide interchange protein DsbD
MRTLRFLLLALATGFAVSTSAAQGLPRFGAPEPHVKAELIAARDAVVAGQPLQVGVRLTHDDEWHTYWQVPGDSGLPTQINWSLPAAIVAGPIEWPHPHRLPAGPLVNFGYEGDTLLLTTLQMPANLTGSAVTLNAKAEWLECKDVCIPGSADLKLTLPVRDRRRLQHAARFAEARKLVPVTLPGLSARGTVDANRIRVAFELPAGRTADKLEFFPLEEGRIEPAAAQVLDRASGLALTLTAVKPIKADSKSLAGVIVANGGPAKSGGWTATVDAPLVAGAVATASAGTAAAVPSTTPTMSLLAALGTAFVGGLILNLMPCVFPVLSLKRSASRSIASQRSDGGHGALRGRCGPVFRAARGLLIACRAGSALGWGFQLQTPWVVASLTCFSSSWAESARRVRIHVRQRHRQHAGSGRTGRKVGLARQLRHRRAGGDRASPYLRVHERRTRLCILSQL